jgi:predicted PurR-regulated permease PerM
MKVLVMGLAILGVTALFASQIKDIDMLIQKINTTKDVKQKTQLLNQLDEEMASVDKDKLQEAQDLVDKKLERPSISQN